MKITNITKDGLVWKFTAEYSAMNLIHAIKVIHNFDVDKAVCELIKKAVSDCKCGEQYPNFCGNPLFGKVSMGYSGVAPHAPSQPPKAPPAPSQVNKTEPTIVGTYCDGSPYGYDCNGKVSPITPAWEKVAAPKQPKEGTVAARVLSYLHESKKPLVANQIAIDLGICNRLVANATKSLNGGGFIKRISHGVYQIKGASNG